VKVFVTRRVPDAVRAELESSFEVDLHDSEDPPSRAELLSRVAGSDAIVTVPVDRVDGELLEGAGPQLRLVANYAVGYDNVDLEAAARAGVVVTNTPDVLTRATAELTIALLLALVRRVAEGDRLLRRGGAWAWAPTFMLGRDLAGKTLAIVGYGRIGREVGRLAGCFGMRVVHASRRDGRRGLQRVLAEADVVSLHVPLNESTRHLIDADALELMRPSAVLVNTARGPVVDEDAVIAALREGRLAGAAFDVFEHEPEISSGLLELENVVVAPHLGSATEEAREAMGMLCVEALRAVLLENRRPPNSVVRELG
jgi:glyoxylate reductase